MNTEQAAKAVGATFRQVDWWVRTGIIAPSSHGRNHHGEYRIWSAADIDRLRVVAQIMALGESGERQCRSGETAKRVMKHWRKGPGWMVLAPSTGKAMLSRRPEKVPKAVRLLGGRVMVVRLP